MNQQTATATETELKPMSLQEWTKWARQKLRPRLFFASTFFKETDEGKKMFSRTYRRPRIEGEIRGKLNIKAAKRERVKLWKAAQAAK